MIVLVDDIYDMYARLSGDSGVLNERQHMVNYANHVLGLDGVDLRETPEKKALLSFEVRVRTLEFLAGWRRAELLYAELLANALGAPLTVFGVKHRLAALQHLVCDPKSKAVYLSHKISKPRRENRNNPGEWIVEEINSMSSPLLSRGIVVVHPTAIDELRMSSWSGEVGLSDRWPLQSPELEAPGDRETQLAYVVPGWLDPPEFRELFSADAIGKGKEAGEAMARFRGFEMVVFEEISARDHLLVSYSDGLLLYRPVIFGEDSSGARSEVKHWQRRWRATTSPDADRPRLVGLYVFDDIDHRLINLTTDERSELKGRMERALEEENIDSEQAKAIVAGLAP